jgi:hypothetical protein
MDSTLSNEIKAWQESGSPQQVGLNWTRSRSEWMQAFPNHSKFLLSLPENIDRSCLRSICNTGNALVFEKFLAVMVWGYSNLGYGTYRVLKMFNTANSILNLEAASEFCRSNEPKSAYEYLMNNRLSNLGPSYASKYISFSTPRETSAPILDSLILLWIQKYAQKDFAGLSIAKMGWNIRTYSFYCDWIESHANANNCFPDEVELVLFRMAELEFSKTSIWANK